MHELEKSVSSKYDPVIMLFISKINKITQSMMPRSSKQFVVRTVSPISAVLISNRSCKLRDRSSSALSGIRAFAICPSWIGSFGIRYQVAEYSRFLCDATMEISILLGDSIPL